MVYKVQQKTTFVNIKLNIYTNFGSALKEALLRRGKTSAWLSRKTGKDKGQISKYINGNTVPRDITQRELTNPLSLRIVQKENDKWEIVDDFKFEVQVNEERIDYDELSYKDAKKAMDDFFEQIKDIKALYKEIDSNEKISRENKKLQLQMIRNQIKAIIKNKLYREV